MNLKEFFSDKEMKPADKVNALADLLTCGDVGVDSAVDFASSARDVEKASTIEALEKSTSNNANLLNRKAFAFCVASLSAKAPRVKHESARVIANTCAYFPDMLEDAVCKLLDNSEHAGTVVRWSAATALAKIYSLGTGLNADIKTMLERLAEVEEKNSIKKIYLSALEPKKRKKTEMP